MSTITVKMPDIMVEHLNSEAEKHKTSRSEFVRYCIDKVLSGQVVKEKPSFYELSKDLCGKQKGGPSDLASNQKHLEGFGR